MKQDTLLCTNDGLYRFYDVKETAFSSFFVIKSSSPKYLRHDREPDPNPTLKNKRP